MPDKIGKCIKIDKPKFKPEHSLLETERVKTNVAMEPLTLRLQFQDFRDKKALNWNSETNKKSKTL